MTLEEETILEEAARITSQDRNEAYGNAIDNFTDIAIGWNVILKNDLRDGVRITPDQVALMMVWMKISRQLKHDKRDNWVDMAGYARLGGNIMGHV